MPAIIVLIWAKIIIPRSTFITKYSLPENFSSWFEMSRHFKLEKDAASKRQNQFSMIWPRSSAVFGQNIESLKRGKVRLFMKSHFVEFNKKKSIFMKYSISIIWLFYFSFWWSVFQWFVLIDSFRFKFCCSCFLTIFMFWNSMLRPPFLFNFLN
jgi:hypothetical protein